MTIHIIIIVAMVFFKAIFSAGDTALTYIDREKLNSKIKKDKRAQKIKDLKENRIGFWGEIELLITTIELIATAYAAEFLVDPVSEIFMPFVENGSLEYMTAINLSVLIVGFLLTYIFLVFGYILPKQLARNNPEKMSYKTINILWFMAKLNKPFEIFVRATTKTFSKIFRIPENTEYKLTEKELKMLIRESMSDGIIGKEEKAIILNTIKFDAILVKDKMISKENVEYISLNASKNEIIKSIKKHKFSRMPVYSENEDNIIGIFNMKDIIVEKGIPEKIEIKDFLRESIKVNKKDSLTIALKKMQSQNQRMAIVYDDKENYCGIITVEDIIEKLVGDILDDNDLK